MIGTGWSFGNELLVGMSAYDKENTPISAFSSMYYDTYIQGNFQFDVAEHKAYKIFLQRPSTIQMEKPHETAVHDKRVFASLYPKPPLTAVVPPCTALLY